MSAWLSYVGLCVRRRTLAHVSAHCFQSFSSRGSGRPRKVVFVKSRQFSSKEAPASFSFQIVEDVWGRRIMYSQDQATIVLAGMIIAAHIIAEREQNSRHLSQAYAHFHSIDPRSRIDHSFEVFKKKTVAYGHFLGDRRVFWRLHRDCSNGAMGQGQICRSLICITLQANIQTLKTNAATMVSILWSSCVVCAFVDPNLLILLVPVGWITKLRPMCGKLQSVHASKGLQHFSEPATEEISWPALGSFSLEFQG